jgi:hypothetical protein
LELQSALLGTSTELEAQNLRLENTTIVIKGNEKHKAYIKRLIML